MEYSAEGKVRRLLQAIKPQNEDENERTNVDLYSFARSLVQSSFQNKYIVGVSIILFWHFGDITTYAGPANE